MELPDSKQSHCLVLSSDLMFGSQAAQAARDAGYEVGMFNDAGALVQAFSLSRPSSQSADDVDSHARLVLIDLTTPHLDAERLAHQLQQTPTQLPPRLVAVGPHVHQTKLDAARNAGWQVYTRGRFHAQGPELLGE